MKFVKRGLWATVALLIGVFQLAGRSGVSGVDSIDFSADKDPFLLVIEHEVGVGATVHLVITSEKPLENTELRTGDHGMREILLSDYQGPPFARMFNIVAPSEPGLWSIDLWDSSGNVIARTEMEVGDGPSRARPLPSNGVWEIERDWDASWERVFSFWVAHLFRPLPGQKNKGWKPLDSVLTSKTRNFLFNRLGHDEDSRASDVHVRARADCGDLPYQLRAYFAWKFGLPFRFRHCNRGNGVKGPRCRFALDNLEDRYDGINNPVERFNQFIKQSIAWRVHSGTLRTLPEDEESDFYPIPLDRNAIRPGTVFVDVGSHALMVTQFNDEGLFGVDGHPDDTVTRKRFSKKNFKHFPGQRTGGFKAFRPIEVRGDRIVPISSRDIGPLYSLDQYRYKKNSRFYQHMSNLIGVQ